MRQRAYNRENTAILKSNTDANPVSRSALNEIGNKVSCITLENNKRREIGKKGSLRQRTAVPKTTVVKEVSFCMEF